MTIRAQLDQIETSIKALSDNSRKAINSRYTYALRGHVNAEIDSQHTHALIANGHWEEIAIAVIEIMKLVDERESSL